MSIAAVLAACGIALWFVPQFNLLNYYFALAVAFVAPLCAGLVAARLPHDHPGAGMATLAAAALLAGLALLLLPLVLVTAAAPFVQNCDFLAGLLCYLMGPGLGVVYGASAGLLLGCSLRRPWATAGVPLWWLLFAGLALLHFYNHPPIFTYNAFVGFVSGAVYDDIVRVSGTYGAYRAYTTLQAAMLVSAAWIIRDLRAKRAFRRARIALPVALLVAQAPLYLLRAEIGWELRRDDIAERLGGRLETAHFVIHYPSGGEMARRIRRVAADHEHRFGQLARVLGKEPKRKIRSFIYEDEAQKQRLMGAGATYIAKPWSGEIHLNAIDIGAPVLKHEMAHVFGAEIAGGWLGIPTHLGLVPRMAIVEGFAVALTEVRGRLTLHQWSAAMYQEGIAPPLQRILDSGGFLATHAGKAYTLAGSFMRFLLETRGVERFQRLYATGSLDSAYPDESAGALVAEWEAFLRDRARVPLGEADLRLARFHFDAPSRFHRVCTLEVAGWERDAREAHEAGDDGEAIRLYEKVLGFDPENPSKRWQLLGALIDARRLGGASELARELASDERTGHVLRANARIRLADVLWLQGRTEEAAEAYRALLDEPLDDDTLRRLHVCAEAASWPSQALRDGVRDYLLGPEETAEAAIARLRTLAAAPGRSPTVAYLLGRRLFAEDRFEEADAALGGSLREGLSPGALERAALEQQGVARLLLGDPASARALFEAARALHESQGYRDALSDWIERADWARLHPGIFEDPAGSGGE